MAELTSLLMSARTVLAGVLVNVDFFDVVKEDVRIGGVSLPSAEQ